MRLKTISESLDSNSTIEQFNNWMEENGLQLFEMSWEKHDSVYSGYFLCKKGENLTDDNATCIGYGEVDDYESYMSALGYDEDEDEDFDDGLDKYEPADASDADGYEDNMVKMMKIYPKELSEDELRN